MIKIYAESPSENVTLLKNEMFEHTLGETEKIIRTIKNMDDEVIGNILKNIKNMNRRCTLDHPNSNLKLVIELNLVPYDIDKPLNRSD